MASYKDIIDQYRGKQIKPPEIMNIFASLKEAGASRQDITKDLQSDILSLFEADRTKEQQEYFNTFLLDLISFFSTFMLKPTAQVEPEVEVVEEGCETAPEDMIYPNPKESQPIHYDKEFLKTVGWENPDG